MTKELAQFADALKAAGDALMKLGELFEKHATKQNVIPLEHSSSRRKRSAKDLNAPKKNLTSYFLFCEEMRPQITKEHPTSTVPKISKLLGEKWKSLGEKDKKVYQEAANKDKIRYEKEMAVYNTTDTIDSSKVVKKAKSKSTKTTTGEAPAHAAPPESSVISNETTGKTETHNEQVSDKTTSSGKEKEKKKKKNKKAHKNKH